MLRFFLHEFDQDILSQSLDEAKVTKLILGVRSTLILTIQKLRYLDTENRFEKLNSLDFHTGVVKLNLS